MALRGVKVVAAAAVIAWASGVNLTGITTGAPDRASAAQPGQPETTVAPVIAATGAPLTLVDEQILGAADPSADGPGTYVALGDSFQSGEGTYVYMWQTDELGVNNCRRSTSAYPYLLWSEGFFGDLDLEFWACAGSSAGDMLTTEADGGSPPWDDPGRPEHWSDRYLPGYEPAGGASSLDRLDETTRVVTVGTGGNDLGFGDIIKSCVTARVTAQYFTGRCVDRWDEPFAADLATLEGDTLPAIYDEITRRAPNAEIFVVGYPRFFPADGGSDATSVAFQDRCNYFIHPEQLWVNEAVVAANDAIEAVAAQYARVHYVDVFDSNEGDELCTGLDNSINGLVWNSLDFLDMAGESFHPTDAGHRGFADAIAGQAPALLDAAQAVRLEAGESEAVTVEVGGASALVFDLAWYEDVGPFTLEAGRAQGTAQADADFAVTVTTPWGTEVDLDGPGVSVETSDQRVHLVVDEPAPGTWTVTVTARHAGTGDAAATYSVATR